MFLQYKIKSLGLKLFLENFYSTIKNNYRNESEYSKIIYEITIGHQEISNLYENMVYLIIFSKIRSY